jgi:hypothetical protein
MIIIIKIPGGDKFLSGNIFAKKLKVSNFNKILLK